jgi:uracil-DNA glycosylase family 4
MTSLTECRQCPRLADFLSTQRAQYPDYHARPVEPFGDPDARLLIVGLAPGMHGANATGRPFTGDHAGILLYQTLFDYGFSNQATATHRDDSLTLRNCRITNAVKCLPPHNKPNNSEIKTCNAYLAAEIAALPAHSIVLALGSIAHQAVLRALACKLSAYAFSHGALHKIDTLYLLDSYHCSRYNTQTRRLTAEMFQAVFAQAKALLADG